MPIFNDIPCITADHTRVENEKRGQALRCAREPVPFVWPGVRTKQPWENLRICGWTDVRNQNPTSVAC
jgi:hypothetical protein